MKKTTFNFSIIHRILFYSSYLYYKIISPFEIKNPRWKMYTNELIYFAGKIYKPLGKRSLPYSIKKVSTRFGTYNVRPNSLDSIWASPAFERLDVNYLIKLIDSLVKHKKKILFLDIGSDFGTYSVTIGNRFSEYKDLHIHAFEPSKESFELLASNVSLNKLEGTVSLHNFGLLDVDKTITLYTNKRDPGSNSLHENNLNSITQQESIEVRQLDMTNIEYEMYDAVILKIDVEGVESRVLTGSKKLLTSNTDKYFVVEDFVNPLIIPYMETIGALFCKKVTSYNSWWKMQKHSAVGEIV